MLVVIPTPIGNLKDISIRQYELIHACDILACEDTRTTGKLINLLKRMRLKDETMSKFDGIKPKPPEPEPAAQSENVPSIPQEKPASLSLSLEQEAKVKLAIQEYYANKSIEIPTLKVDKEDVHELLNSPYFRKVLDDEDYETRKKVLEYCLPLIEQRMEEVAKNYDEEKKLSYIMKRKPVFEKEEKKESQEDTEQNTDEYQFLHGIDNEKIQEIKDHIYRIKKRKGRGLLISLHAENESKRIPRLVKMMKLGFRVGLLSEAGTPSISDPGTELIQTAVESGISVEALPGPCAGLVGLVASGLQQSGFVFHGFLAKNRAQKKKTLMHYHRLGLPVILYESFERIIKTLESIEEIYGSDHQVYLGAELTKMHERHYHGTIEKIKDELKQTDMKYKGELAVVVGGLADEKGLDPTLEEDEVIINAEELARTLSKEVSMKDRGFKELMIKITGLKQAHIARIISKIRPRKRKLDEIDRILQQEDEEQINEYHFYLHFTRYCA
eukprot:TRINITY_DN71298_c0_g1_i1.p1 TRINITY_DN71298_c0_g1~~TRINITY_DN71298_c0_g1_i1.p1  ORF type:complete len:499 (-),score=69.56 TRINITY_DN71298_c0_g1_i1:44-1540(-)